MLTKYLPQNQSLQTYNGGRFIEKILTDAYGQQFKVVFFVSLVDGEVKGKLVSAQPIARASAVSSYASHAGSENIVFLPIHLSVHKTVTEYVLAYAPVVSPYNELFFFTSQPTRAPSF